MSKLVFKIGEETLPTVLSNDVYSDSPFADQLESAKKRLMELLEKWRARKGALKNDNSISGLNFSEQPVDNNIIAFLGERGSGKTSCMYSIKEIFSNSTDTGDFSKDTEFLNIIDPSFFDEHHNILEILIGELYHEYEKIVENWERMKYAERQEVRDLHGWFGKVRQSIKFLSVQKLEIPDEQEGLAALSEGVNLRILVSGLVNAFLLCKKKKYLVVSIDDIDLNIREAYRMMEQIRKYLVVPNVVILMAAKLKQLKNSIVLNLTEYYKSILPSIIDLNGIQTMADRYLDKFIPLERRINMPTFADYSSAQLEIIGKEESVPSEEFRFESVEFAVLSLIYKKCGYLFYNYEDTPSLIIPENMRELRSFVTLLYELDDRSDKTTHTKNKNIFKEYLHIQWLQRLPNEQREIAMSILKEKDPTKINKSVVTSLYGYAKSLGIAQELNKTDKTENINLTLIRLKEIENPADYAENISIGDVMAVVNYLNNIAGSTKIHNLLFFVSTFYSMKLYELYDDMTDDIDSRAAVNQDGNDLPNSTNEKQAPAFPKLKNSKDYKIYDYFKVVGNGFFTLTGESFLPPADNRAYSRELSLMNGSLLFEVIDDLVSEYENDNKVLENPDFIGRLKVAEFFMLCTSRMIESRDGYFSPFLESNWRSEASEFYFYPFDSGLKTILFDATAPFVNLCIPKTAYRRFSNKIVDIALTCKDSLISQLYKRDKRYNALNEEHDLLSRVAIRNIEVLKDVNLWLVKNKDIFKDDRDDDLKILTKFYKSFNGTDNDNEGYAVRTYELNTGSSDYHTINFTPFNVLVEFLDSIALPSKKNGSVRVRKQHEVLFMRIYRRESLLASDTLYSLPELIRILRDSKESDIPVKDTIISRVVKRSKGRILSNLLVEYLAEIDIVEKVLFSTYFDDALFAKYKDLVTVNLKNHRDNLERQIKGLEARSTSFDYDKRKIEDEHTHIDGQIATVKNRQKNEKDALNSAEKSLRQLTFEIENIKIKVNNLNDRLTRFRQDYVELDVTFKEFTKEQRLREEVLHRKEKGLLKAEGDDYKASLKSEIQDLRRSIVDIAEKKENQRVLMEKKSSDIENLSAQVTSLLDEESKKQSIIEEKHKERQNLMVKIKQDEAIFDNLHAEAKVVKQRKKEIKDALLSIEANIKNLNLEYTAFTKRANLIISSLNSRT